MMAKTSKSRFGHHTLCSALLASVVVGGCAGTNSSGRLHDNNSNPPGGGRWTAPCCQIHKDCFPTPRKVSTCSEESQTIKVSDVYQRGDALLGQNVHLQGPLHVLDGVCTMAMCRSSGDCCNQCFGWLVLGDPHGQFVMLRHHTCYGDESSICCRTEARGQDVVVTGTLVRLRGGGADGKIPGDPQEPAVAYAIEGISENGAPLCSPR